MKIARVERASGPRVALVEGRALRLLSSGVDVLEVLTDPTAAVPTEESIPLADAQLLPPLQPPSVRDFVTFEQHVEGMAKLHDPPRDVHPQWYEAPTFYFSNPHSVVGANEDVPVPPGCTVLDYELEVAAIIGRDGRDLDPESAAGHIAGFTIFNDWSARDLQFAEMQVGLGPAKGKDSAITLGPWIVTVDELEPYRQDGRLALRMEVSVNGERRGGDTLANMAWSFEELAAYASRGAWIRTGDVLGSGTCGGGCLGELWGRAGKQEPPPLAPGDVVSMTVEGIGTIANRVVRGVEPVPLAQGPEAEVMPRVFYDLSDLLSNDTSEFEFNKHEITYVTPEVTAAQSADWGLGPEYWPGGVALSAEVVTLTTHSGTHVDAPLHYGPAVSGPTRTIDEVPLEWCYGSGVRLDLRHADRAAGITRTDVEAELDRIGHVLEPLDIVLVWTGTDLKQPGYEARHAGLRRDATEFLVDHGIKLIGIDAWGLDRAFDVMIEDAQAGRAQFWESHLLGREKEYCQIERLANLDTLPRPTGFTISAFPFKLEHASAAWARVVAIFDE